MVDPLSHAIGPIGLTLISILAIGHEGAGSLLSLLKQRCWAEGVTAGDGGIGLGWIFTAGDWGIRLGWIFTADNLGWGDRVGASHLLGRYNVFLRLC